MLHIQLLGDFSLCYGDTIVTTVQSPQEQSLLAYLLLHREAPQSRQHISFLFWPDSTEAQARRQLRKVLFRLRQDLPQADDFLQMDAQTIQWRPDAQFVLDVAGFEGGLALAEQLIASGSRAAALLALEKALALYKGDLLPGCYDDWISPERERLSQSFVRALEEATTLLEMQREYTRAINIAQRLLLHDPLHEPGYRSLMRLQALVGNRATALRVYHTCVTTLQRELGVEPDADTLRVYERLLRTGVQTQSASVLPLPVLTVSQPLVGRHEEWQQLLSIWRHAIGGVSQLVMMAGVAGIGKTRLAEELARWVKRQGYVVLTARCYAAEGELAYGPVVQWLRARPLPPLESVWRRELARLLPELVSDLPGATPLGPMTETWQRQRLFEALARTVSSGKSPLLLILDDVQWCDQETLEWLHYLLHFDAAASVLILATLRLEEVGVDHPLSVWMRSAQRIAPVHEIVLGSLTETETLSLAEKVAGHMLEADLAACIFSETEGNPLFVVEMVRAGKLGDAQDLACPLQGLPAQVQATIEGRLALLSPSARALAGLAAVVGREFTFDVLAQASDLERDVTLVALDELWHRRVISEQGGAGYDFTHDKLRQVAYASLTEAHRRALHRKVAMALETVYDNDLAAVSGRIASHYDNGGWPRPAIPYYLCGAEAARQVYANRETIDHYQRVLALTASLTAGEEAVWRVQALGGLGETYLWTGNLDEAEKRLREAIALGKTILLAPREMARLYYWLTVVLALQYRYEEQLYVGEEGLAYLGRDTDSVEAILISGTTALAYHNLERDRERFRELVQHVSVSLEHLSYVRELGPVYERIFDLHLRSKNPQEALRWLDILEHKAMLVHDLEALAIVHHQMGRALFYQGDLDGAIPHKQQAVDYTLESGNISQLAYRLFWLALLTLSSGDLDKAEAHARAAVDAVRNLNVPSRLAYMYWLLGLVLLCKGREREAVEALEQALALREVDRQPEVTMLSHQLLGRVYLDQHDYAAALQQFQFAAALSTPERFAIWHALDVKVYALAFLNTLSGLEEAFNNPAAFRDYCLHFPHRDTFSGHAPPLPNLAQFALIQWYLKPAMPISPERSLLHETFGESQPVEWTWNDPFGDCREEKNAHALQGGLDIHVPNGRDQWYLHRGAPRLLCPLSSMLGRIDTSSLSISGLAFQAVCAPVSDEKPAMGGIMLWVDEENYLRLDRGSGGLHEIIFLGCVDSRDEFIGRGRLDANADTLVASPGSVTLRLEWADNHVRALCSLDETAWFTVGHIDFPFDPHAQFGVYAIGNIDRMIYHGAYPEGTAIRFTSVRCWLLAGEYT